MVLTGSLMPLVIWRAGWGLASEDGLPHMGCVWQSFGVTKMSGSHGSRPPSGWFQGSKKQCRHAQVSLELAQHHFCCIPLAEAARKVSPNTGAGETELQSPIAKVREWRRCRNVTIFAVSTTGSGGGAFTGAHLLFATPRVPSDFTV